MPLERLAQDVGKLQGIMEMALYESRRYREANQQQMREIKTELHEVKTDIADLKRAKCKPPISERVIKQALTIALPAGTLIYTGSLQKAWEVLQLLR